MKASTRFDDLLVVDSVRDIVAHGGVPAVHGQLEIEDHGLLDPPLPVDKADDALGREAAQKDSIAGIRSQVSSFMKGVRSSVSGCSDSSGQRARAWMARPSCWPACKPRETGDRNHRRIVSTEFDARIVHAGALRGARLQRVALASWRLALTPPDTTSVSSPVCFERAQRLRGQGLDDRPPARRPRHPHARHRSFRDRARHAAPRSSGPRS